MADSERRRCFVVAPIGNRGSDTYMRTEDVQDFIIGPAIEQCGYEMPPVRADQIAVPGRITKQIIDHLLNDALVIADLTDYNPNVFYELAVRHAVRKPIVQIIHKLQTIPFDVGTQRTIFYDHQNLRETPRTIKEIVAQIKAAEHDPSNVDTPLSDAIFRQSLSDSSDPIQKSNAEILALLHEIRSSIAYLPKTYERSTSTVADNDSYAYEQDITIVQSSASNHLAEIMNTGFAEGDLADHLPLFVSGDRVTHKNFGTGTVLRVDGRIIHIAFPAPMGVKKLDIGYAKLVKV